MDRLSSVVLNRGMSRIQALVIVVGVVLGGTACNHGYLSPEAMESGQIGPRYCASACQELGLRMGAFVMVQHNYAGCVCEPMMTAGGSTAVHATAVQAGATEAIAQSQRRSGARNQQQQGGH